MRLYKLREVYRHFLVVLFFAVTAIALLAPLASNKYVPVNDPLATDFVDHTRAIFQAKQAISEGQFPLRVAPSQFDNLRYPLFQFYGNLPYTIAGLLGHVGANPFAALKLTVWLALVFGGIYIYRMAFLLCGSSVVSLLTGLVYIGAPYSITNIIWRGAFTEAIAQGILPMALFYTYRIYDENYKTRVFCLAALSWFLLAISHLITFSYTAVFIGLFVFLLFLRDRKKWQGMLFSALAIVVGIVLALWFLAPMLFLEKMVTMSDWLLSPFSFNWLTSLASLFSVSAAPPLRSSSVFSIPCAIGLPIIMSIGIIICIPEIKFFKICEKMNKLVVPLLILFLLAFFMVWSPFDFWKLLPRITDIAQFSYRLLTQIMWIGSLLFVFAIYGFFRGNLDSRHAVFGILLLCLSIGHWFPGKGVYAADHINKILESPSTVPAYLIKPEQVLNSGTKLNKKNNLFLVNTCKQNKYTKECAVQVDAAESLVQLPQLYYPGVLKVRANGKDVAYQPISYDGKVLTAIILSRGNYNITTSFCGLSWANWISACAWLIFIAVFMFDLLKSILPKLTRRKLTT